MVPVNRVVVDARRLLCPMPVIRVQNKVAGLSAGTLVEAVCTDSGALNDLPSWCVINGHRVVETRCCEGEYLIILEVGEG